MNIRISLSVAGLVVGVGLAHAAVAGPFMFDPTGPAAGAAISADTMIHAPGNALAVGGVTAFNNWMGGSGPTGFDLRYQANLDRLTLSGSTVFSQGTGGPYFTYAMSLGETITNVAVLGNTVTVNYAFDPLNPGNSFSMYATQSPGDDLTGAGFTHGVLILSAHFTGSGGSYTIPNIQASQILDQANGPFGTQLTTVGSGSFFQTMTVDYVSTDYFPGFGPGTMGSFLTIAPNDPFMLTHPSARVVGVVPNVGLINGLTGPDMLFEADPTQVFYSIPEPASLALIVLGLSGVALGRRIRSPQAAAAAG